MMRRSAFGSEAATAQLFALPPMSLSKQFDLLRQVVGSCDRFRHGARGVIGQHKAVIALPLQQHTFENVLAEIDPDD